jgi:hypothetical protein
MTRSELPGLTPARAAALEGTWNDGGLWEDVMWLSRQCWREGSADHSALRWHHFVLAVGNFKRQAGRISPSPISVLPDSDEVPRDEFLTPSGLALGRDREESWQQLSDIPGVALATATTLLAALWPEDHFIFDWRVQVAADGIRIHAGMPPTPKTQREMATRKRHRPGFEDYTTVRTWLKTVDCPLRTSERALYRLSQKVGTVRGRSWPDYGKAVALRLQDS